MPKVNHFVLFCIPDNVSYWPVNIILRILFHVVMSHYVTDFSVKVDVFKEAIDKLSPTLAQRVWDEERLEGPGPREISRYFIRLVQRNIPMKQYGLVRTELDSSSTRLPKSWKYGQVHT